MRKRTILSFSMLAIPIMLLGWWYYEAFVAPNHPPRPANVPPSATLVLQGFNAFWQRCWFDESLMKDKCQIFNRVGGLIQDDVFLSYDGKATISASQLTIVPGGGWDNVHLEDGSILIPEHGYEAIRKVITPPANK